MNRLFKIRLLLFIIIVLTFGRAIGNDFVNWDDSKLIYFNPGVAHPTLASLGRQWVPSDPGNNFMFDPLVYNLWWCLAHFAQLETPDLLGGSLNPYVFHAANLLVHWLTVCVVFEILKQFKIPVWPALAGTILFAIHPMQTESVVWATAMKDLLSGFFAMLTILQYMRAVESTGQSRRTHYILTTTCFLAAILAKPSTLTLPLIVGSIDFLYYRRPWQDITRWLAPWFIPVIATWMLAAKIQPVARLAHMPLWSRPLVALDALAFYLYKLVLPFNLSFDYGRSPVALFNNSALHHPLRWTWIFPVLAVGIILRLGKRWLSVAGLIFLFSVLPVLGLTPFVYQYFSTVADRYVYVGMLGMALILAHILQRFPRKPVFYGTGFVLAGLCCLSFAQAGVWKDTPTLFDHAIALNKVQGLHFKIYGVYEEHEAAALSNQAIFEQQHGQLVESRASMRLANEHWEKAIALYRKSLELNPELSDSYDKLATLLVKQDRTDEAIPVVERWLKLQTSGQIDTLMKPGQIEGMLGNLYLRVHRYQDAVVMLEFSQADAPDPETEKTLEKARKLAATKPTSMP